MQALRRYPLQNISSKFFNQVAGANAYSTKVLHDVGQPTAATHPKLLKEGEITPGITCEEYIMRRKKLLELLPEKSLAIVASAPIKMMTDVVPYPFRQDADYLYITGCQQPGGVAVLGHDCGLCMFMPEADPHDVLWQGEVAGVDAALQAFKADQAYPINRLHKILSGMIGSCSNLFHNVKTASSAYMDLEPFKKAYQSGIVKDFSIYTHEARLALIQTMLHSKLFPHEGFLSAKFEYECKMRGAQRMAFNPVVGGGPNGSIIHYARNDQKIEDGNLVLMDVGCELHGYVSDITRTWPPCGRFSPVHVEKMQKAFKEIGLLKDNRPERYHMLNPTSIGHYLGMDVHDCSTVSFNRTLKPGVVITIEPGVYIPSNSDVPERYRGIGIRIEDEVLITETGYEVLTGSIPKEIKHIESLLNNFSNGIESHNSTRAAFR
nr:probable Xaa-Pro aminopeptidase 3 [Ipomoea batatas]